MFLGLVGEPHLGATLLDQVWELRWKPLRAIGSHFEWILVISLVIVLGVGYPHPKSMVSPCSPPIPYRYHAMGPLGWDIPRLSDHFTTAQQQL